MTKNLIRFTQDENGKQTVTDMQGKPIDGVRSIAIVAEAGKPTRVVADLCAMAVELHGMPVVFDRDRLIEALLERIEALKAGNSTLQAGNLEVSCKAQAFDNLTPHLSLFNEMINKGEILRDDGPWTNSVLEIVHRYIVMLKGRLDSREQLIKSRVERITMLMDRIKALTAENRTLQAQASDMDRELQAARSESDLPTLASSLAKIARNGEYAGDADGAASELPTIEQLEAGLAKMAPHERAIQLTKLAQKLPESSDTPQRVADDGAETDADRSRRLGSMLERAKVTLWALVTQDAFWTELVGKDPGSQLEYIRERARAMLDEIENDGLKAIKRAQSEPVADHACAAGDNVPTTADSQRLLDYRAVSHRILAEALARVATGTIDTGPRTFARNVLCGLQLKLNWLLPRCIVSISGEGHLHPTLAEVGLDLPEPLWNMPIFAEPSVAGTVGYPPMQEGRLMPASAGVDIKAGEQAKIYDHSLEV